MLDLKQKQSDCLSVFPRDSAEKAVEEISGDAAKGVNCTMGFGFELETRKDETGAERSTRRELST